VGAPVRWVGVRLIGISGLAHQPGGDTPEGATNSANDLVLVQESDLKIRGVGWIDAATWIAVLAMVISLSWTHWRRRDSRVADPDSEGSIDESLIAAESEPSSIGPQLATPALETRSLATAFRDHKDRWALMPGRDMARWTLMIAFAGLLVLFISDGTGNGTQPSSGNFANTSSSSPSALSYALVVVGCSVLLLAVALFLESVTVVLRRRRGTR
jgi:hypothetical protein